MSKRALIAMSGGVDSSVSAYLMKEQGYDCVGVTMKLYDNEDINLCTDKTCCSLSDVEDARAVCDRIGIPYYVMNFKDKFKEKVMDKFVDCYRQGCTPNPCIDCNRHLKFAGLYQKAKELECDVIVTGHYVRVAEDESGFHLYKGKDEKKDQSYVLYNLTKEQLAHTMFPLGSLTKDEVRKIAQENGFINARKKESQDICFIPDGDYRRFLEEKAHMISLPGDFVDKEGNVIAKHKGYFHYTIGQRKGLGISAKEPYYVVDILPKKNQVVLGSNEDLFRTTLIANDFNWIEQVEEGERIQAKIRYAHKQAEAAFRILEDGNVQVTFTEPQRAFTKGQSVVLYQGEKVLGGGIIHEIM